MDSCSTFEPAAGRVSHWYDVGVSCTFLLQNPSYECEECVAGKFSDTTGVAACTNCAAGTFSTVAGLTNDKGCQQVSGERASESETQNAKHKERQLHGTWSDFSVSFNECLDEAVFFDGAASGVTVGAFLGLAAAAVAVSLA